MIHPFLVIEIPFYGLLDTLLKLERWLPTQFLLQLSRVAGITHIVTLSVCYISDEIHILTFLSAKQSINSLDNHLDDIDILPLIETRKIAAIVAIKHCKEDKIWQTVEYLLKVERNVLIKDKETTMQMEMLKLQAEKDSSVLSSTQNVLERIIDKWANK